jgi:hypothetical protein
MTARTDISPKRTSAPAAWATCGLLVAAMALPLAHAADTSAAAASALKVLAAPSQGVHSASAPMGNTSMGDAQAGGASMEKAATAHAPAANLITVQKGESIDAVLRRGLPGMPLKDDVLRQALAKANPKIFPKGQTYPVRAGTVLALPSVESLRQHLLAQSPQAAALFQVTASPPEVVETNTGPDKRRWVRFP